MAEEQMPPFQMSQEMHGRCSHKLLHWSIHHTVFSSTFQYYTQSGHLVQAQILKQTTKGPMRKRERENSAVWEIVGTMACSLAKRLRHKFTDLQSRELNRAYSTATSTPF